MGDEKSGQYQGAKNLMKAGPCWRKLSKARASSGMTDPEGLASERVVWTTRYSGACDGVGVGVGVGSCSVDVGGGRSSCGVPTCSACLSRYSTRR